MAVDSLPASHPGLPKLLETACAVVGPQGGGDCPCSVLYTYMPGAGGAFIPFSFRKAALALSLMPGAGAGAACLPWGMILQAGMAMDCPH